MMRIFIYIIILSTLISAKVVSAAADDNYTYQFNSESQQAQFDQLTHELRCLVCQNETLADSNAPLAKDLRNKIAAQITAGDSDQEIVDYLIKRYGDFILYKPRLNSTTYVLWFSPALLLLFGIVLWWRISSSQQLIQQ